MPFINLALVAEFGLTCSVPARIGHIRAAELILLGLPFDAKRPKLAVKPADALQASKRLMKRSFRGAIEAAMKAENEEFSRRVRSGEAKEAFAAFLEKRPPDFGRTTKSKATA